MPDDVFEGENEGMGDGVTEGPAPMDPAEVALGMAALREFLIQVSAEGDCEWHFKRLAILALEFCPEPEALRQGLAEASALELHMYLLALHWGRGVLDDALANLCGNARLSSLAQALHPRTVSGDALPRLPLLPAAGRRWRAESLGVEGVTPLGTEWKRSVPRGKARRRLDALGQGQSILLKLLTDRRHGADFERWQRVTVNLMGRYPERGAWSRAQLWALSAEALQDLHVAVEDLRFVMDAALSGLFAVSHRSLRCIQRLVARWPSAAQLFAEAQRSEPAAVWLSHWVGPAPPAALRRKKRRAFHHTLYALRRTIPRK